MGNRAIIMGLNSERKLDEVAVYLHWDGSPNQVKAFLAYCRMMQYRSPETDWYGWAQLIKTIGNFIDHNKKSNGLSFGVFSAASDWRDLKQKAGTLNERFLKHMSPGDNGVYIISDWTIVRHYGGDDMEEMTPGILKELLKEINQYQPFHLPDETIDEFVKKEGFYYI